MEATSTKPLLLDVDGKEVYISDEWKQGETIRIRLPFHILCIYCKGVSVEGEEVDIHCKMDSHDRRSERYRCTSCNRTISLVFDEVDELMCIKGGRVIKDKSETLSSEELRDSDTTEEEEEEEKSKSNLPSTDLTADSTSSNQSVFVLNGMKVNIHPKKRRVHSKKQTVIFAVSFLTNNHLFELLGKMTEVMLLSVKRGGIKLQIPKLRRGPLLRGFIMCSYICFLSNRCHTGKRFGKLSGDDLVISRFFLWTRYRILFLSRK